MTEIASLPKLSKCITNDARYTTQKIIPYVLHSDIWHCYKNVEIPDLQLAYQNHDTVEMFNYKKKTIVKFT